LIAEIEIIDFEYEAVRKMVEVELKEILDDLDERRGGRIGETFNKLSELMADQRRAEEYVT
jgi:hypothetical protein